MSNDLAEIKQLEKEIAKLKRENKKLKNALDEESIEADTEVLGKKASKTLTGKELKIAAEKRLKVRYIEKYFNPQDRHMNYNGDCIMRKCKEDDENDDSYYIGDSDICLDEYDDNDVVCGDFPDGTFEVRRAKGVRYE